MDRALIYEREFIYLRIEQSQYEQLDELEAVNENTDPLHSSDDEWAMDSETVKDGELATDGESASDSKSASDGDSRNIEPTPPRNIEPTPTSTSQLLSETTGAILLHSLALKHGLTRAAVSDILEIIRLHMPADSIPPGYRSLHRLFNTSWSKIQ